MPRLTLFFLLIGLVPSAPAVAETIVVDSLDLRVAAAERVVVGTVVESQVLPYRSGGGWRFTLARLAIEETLRGAPAKEVRVVVRGGMVVGPWSSPGTRILAFLVSTDRVPDLPETVPEGSWAAAPGVSSIADRGIGALRLDPKAPPVVTRDFRVLRQPAQVLPAARAAACTAPTEPPKVEEVHPPFDSAAHRLLFAGSVVIVRVPVDSPRPQEPGASLEDRRMRATTARPCKHRR